MHMPTMVAIGSIESLIVGAKGHLTSIMMLATRKSDVWSLSSNTFFVVASYHKGPQGNEQ